MTADSPTIAATRLAALRAELAGQLARFASVTPIQTLLAETIQNASAPLGPRVVALKAMAQSGLKEAPRAWSEAIAAVGLLPGVEIAGVATFLSAVGTGQIATV